MPMLPQIERELARRAFAAAEGDATAAAKSLGLTKVALQKRLKE
jgi:DNA-binding protein Fis